MRRGGHSGHGPGGRVKSLRCGCGGIGATLTQRMPRVSSPTPDGARFPALAGACARFRVQAPIAQLDRALVYGTRCRKFESSWARVIARCLPRLLTRNGRPRVESRQVAKSPRGMGGGKTLSCGRQLEPGGWNSLPSAWSGLPATWKTLPSDGIELPTDRHELPSDRQGLPVDRRELPSRRQELPVDRHDLPSHRQELPVDRHEPRSGRGPRLCKLATRGFHAHKKERAERPREDTPRGLLSN
jgi:hypothetical protein